jgi:glycosyltransferase involved in cell wall biosynthesis
MAKPWSPSNPPGRLSGDSGGVTICIPAFNEATTIESVVLDARRALEQAEIPGEILVLDDGSRDRTWQLLRELQKEMPVLQLRRHPDNRGIASTFAELYRWASKPLVFLNSGDGQWHMNILLELLPMVTEFDIVVARRRVKHYSYGRLLISWLFNALPALLFATPTYDAGSVKLVRREIYDIPLISKGVFGEAERIIRASRRGFRIGVKDVDHLPRLAGKASGARVSLVLQAMLDLSRCWVDIVIRRRS